MLTNQVLPDPRIGILIREGQLIYYACINGEFPERDTVDGIMVLLEGREQAVVANELASSPKRVSKRERRDYLVNISLKHPAWNDHPFDLPITAYTARDAEKQARNYIHNEDIYDRHSGPIYVKARRAD